MAFIKLGQAAAAPPGDEWSFLVLTVEPDRLYLSAWEAEALPPLTGDTSAAAVLAFGLEDGSNEQNGYTPTYGYMPVNGPMVVAMPGTMMMDPNRWQPLALVLLKQSGVSDKMDPVLGPYAPHLTPHWTAVTPFALRESDRTPNTHFDPGTPPHLGGEGNDELIENIVHLIEMSGHLAPDDEEIIDISPGARGNADLGDYDGAGHALNPVIRVPYPLNVIKRGDHARILAEFWADGPDSETAPGHWNRIANYVSDQPLLKKRIGGVGPEVDDLGNKWK